MPSVLEFMRLTERESDTAVIFDNGCEKHRMVYFELNMISNVVSRYLGEHGLENEVVGIIHDAPLQYPALVLGVLKANAAFLSIDTDGPEELLRCLIVKLAIRVLLCSTEQRLLLDALSEFKPEVYPVPNASLKAIHLQSITRVKVSSSLAYVITTSGTTGRPKVVKVQHKCIAPNITYFKEKFQMTANDVVFQASPWTFDPSLVNLFSAVSSGAALLIVPDSLKLLPHKLTDILLDNRVSIIQATPALISSFPVSLLQDKLLSATSSVRILALGGEQCPRTSTLGTWRGHQCIAKFFNVYGITEVSCWATCHEVREAELTEDSAVPVGECLPDTRLVIRDSEGRESDAGILYIGGENRVCVIDDEAEPYPGTLRCTGDQVCRHEDGMIYYEGRTDEQCKRNGKRLNLLQLQEVAIKSQNIVNAVALMDDSRQLLVLFVSLSLHSDIVSNAPEPSADPASPDTMTANVISQLQHHIKSSLPSQYLPDDIIVLNFFPVTGHGKIDKKILMQRVQERSAIKSGKCLESLHSILRDVLRTDLDMDKTFIQNGGNSFMLLSFINKIELQFNIDLDGTAFEMLILKALANALQVVERKITHKDITSNKRKNVDIVIKTDHTGEYAKDQETGPAKKPKMTSTYFNSIAEFALQRCCVILRYGKCGMLKPQYSKSFNKQPPLLPEGIVDKTEQHARMRERQLNLTLKFKYDLGKCIDASPLFCSVRGGDEQLDLLVIGSHSHRLAAVHARTGQALWDISLSHRVESSACLSACGHYVVVGCYDGTVYVVELLTGALAWAFPTGGEVKSSPCLDPLTGLVIVGSHDKHVYALDIQRRECRWRAGVGGGSVFSSPAVSTQPHLLVASSLTGIVAALNPLDGSVLWKRSVQKPVFSSAAVRGGRVYVGCVDNNLYCFNTKGDKMWVFESQAPIFSSPCVSPTAQHQVTLTASDDSLLHHIDTSKDGAATKDGCVNTNSTIIKESGGETDRENELIVFGSHDHHVYCLTKEGELVWKFKAESPVFSSPYVAELNHAFCNCSVTSKNESKICDVQGHRKVVVACCTTGVLYMLSLRHGSMLTSYKFPHELFSSPLMFDNTIFVGCRDNFLYSIEINQLKH